MGIFFAAMNQEQESDEAKMQKQKKIKPLEKKHSKYTVDILKKKKTACVCVLIFFAVIIEDNSLTL